MPVSKIGIRKYGCFHEEWAELSDVGIINIVIGRNSAGKSHFLDVIKFLCIGRYGEGTPSDCEWMFSGAFDEEAVRKHFPEGRRNSAGMPDDAWFHNGKPYVNRVGTVVWANPGNRSLSIEGEFTHPYCDGRESVLQIHQDLLAHLLSSEDHILSKRVLFRVNSERDVFLEPDGSDDSIDPSGHGITTIVRRCVTMVARMEHRDTVETVLLDALNEVLGGDAQYSRILTRQHHQGHTSWEVFLEERSSRRQIPISRSGSGLKSLFFILFVLIVMPVYRRVSKSNCVFCIEEPENNLHPALLRRVLSYIQRYAKEHGALFFLTTHSGVVLDFFSRCQESRIIRVTKSEVGSRVSKIKTHIDLLATIDFLGSKASDVLQSNGVIWAEGPSDAIYLSRWIYLYSEGKWEEGRHFQCAFYGGSNLAHVQALEPEHQRDWALNLLSMNPNFVVVCDRDRPASATRQKPRVEAIKNQIEALRKEGHLRAAYWITTPREIEGYISGAVWGTATGGVALPDPEMDDSFFPGSEANYWSKHGVTGTKSKTDLARKVYSLLDRDALRGRFDLEEQLGMICDMIADWNR